MFREQLALAADRIISDGFQIEYYKSMAAYLMGETQRRWWHQFAWWRT